MPVLIFCLSSTVAVWAAELPEPGVESDVEDLEQIIPEQTYLRRLNWEFVAGQIGSRRQQFSHVTALEYDPGSRATWVGSADGKLLGFSETRFTEYTLPYRDAVIRINALAYQPRSDDNGILWVGTSVGLFVLIDGDWRLYQTTDGLPGNEVTSLAVMNESVFAGTLDGLALVHEFMFQSFTEKDGLPSNHITTLESAGDSLWIGTNGGLAMFDGGTFESWNVQDGLINPWVTSLVVENYPEELGRPLRVWIGTPLGLSCFCPDIAGEQWKHYTAEDGLSGNWITDLALEAHKPDGYRLWMISHNVGLDCLTLPPGLPPANIAVLRFTAASTSRPLNQTTCLKSCRPAWPPGSRDVLLAGTYQAGTLRAYLGSTENDDDSKFELPVPNMPSAIVRWRSWLVAGLDIGIYFINVEDRTKTIFLFDGNVIKVGPNGGYLLSADSFSSIRARLNALAVDAKGRLWIATNTTGILCCDGTRWQIFTKKHGLPGNNVTALAIDPNEDRVLAAVHERTKTVQQRIAWFDETRWRPLIELLRYETGIDQPDTDNRSFDQAENLDQATHRTPQTITSMAFGSDQRLCVAVYRLGLYVFDQGHWTLYRRDTSALVDNHITKLLADSEGSVWIGTDRGFGRLTAAGVLETVSRKGLPYSQVQDMVVDDLNQPVLYAYVFDLAISRGSLDNVFYQELSRGCLAKFDMQKWTTTAATPVYTLAIDGRYLWLAGRGVIMRYRRF